MKQKAMQKSKCPIPLYMNFSLWVIRLMRLATTGLREFHQAGKIVYDNDFSNVQLTHSAIDSNGNKLLAFDDGNIPMLNLYSKNGFFKNSTTLIGVTDFIDINKKYILYNIGRDIYFGKTNSKVMSKYTAAMVIKI